MTLRRRLGDLVNGVLGRWDLSVVRASALRESPFTAGAALARARAHGFALRSIVDIGASDGKWSVAAMRHFPDCRYLLIEPLEERRAALESLKARDPRVDYVLAAAGAAPGEAVLTVAPDLEGSGIYDTPGSTARSIPVTTVDAEIRLRSLPPPFGLKFDTHGYELPILAGCADTLADTELIVMEVYNFQLGAGALRFHETCAHLESLGFRCLDLADPLLRPADGVLWQMDLLFARADAEPFRFQEYS